MKKTESLINLIEVIMEEETLSKQVSEKLNKVLEILKGDEDLNTKKNKCMYELEELDENDNLEAGIRVQLLDIASVLETL